jgi:hypothetical protein
MWEELSKAQHISNEIITEYNKSISVDVNDAKSEIQGIRKIADIQSEKLDAILGFLEKLTNAAESESLSQLTQENNISKSTDYNLGKIEKKESIADQIARTEKVLQEKQRREYLITAPEGLTLAHQEVKMQLIYYNNM